ncbi:MAG: hypothetical protein QM736_27650 [Vicinamibacterales bacterium]
MSRANPSRARPRNCSGFRSWCRRLSDSTKHAAISSTVENISFDDNVVAIADPPATMMQKVTTVVQSNTAIEAGKTLGIVLLVVLAFFLFLKPMLNKALTPQQTIALPAVPVPAGGAPSAAAVAAAAAAVGAAGGVQGAPTVAQLEEELEGGFGTSAKKRLPALTKHVSKLAEEQPESVARLVRSWMADHE